MAWNFYATNMSGGKEYSMNNIARCLVESPRGYEALFLEDKLLTENREIFLTAEVTAELCNEIIKQVLYLDRIDPGKEITLYINSPGGSVYDGLALYDSLMLIDSPLKTVCLGTCASMGSILFLAGEKREMMNHGRIMIHDASFGRADFSGLKPDEISEKAKDLLGTTTVLRQIVAERTGKSLTAVTNKMKKDSYFSSNEAIEFGLATGIIRKRGA